MEREVRFSRWFACQVGMLMLLAACSAPQKVGQPQVGIERIATGYTVNAQVRSTTAKVLNAKLISAADARQVLQITDVARAALDAASQAYFAGDLKKADRLIVDAEKLHMAAQEQRDRAESLGKEPKPKGVK